MEPVELREMTATTDTIAEHAARLAEARFHARCDAHDPCFGIDIMERQHRLGDPPPPGLAFHTEDHRTPAEKETAVLDALAVAWEWGYTRLPSTDCDELERIYDRIQREEAPDA